MTRLKSGGDDHSVSPRKYQPIELPTFLLSLFMVEGRRLICSMGTGKAFLGEGLSIKGLPCDAAFQNLLIECVGRRVLLIGGYSLMAAWAILFMVALSLQDQLNWIPYLSMACIFAYILSFGIGPAGVTGIIPTEIFDQVARPAAYTISGSLLWINLFLVGLAFPFLLETLGYYCYLPFFTVCVGTALYVWFFLPETKGRSFLEISEEFVKRNFGDQPGGNTWVRPEETMSTVL